MNEKIWVCGTCGKADFAAVEEALAKPEHTPYRGVDVGSCKGKMIPIRIPNYPPNVWRKIGENFIKKADEDQKKIAKIIEEPLREFTMKELEDVYSPEVMKMLNHRCDKSCKHDLGQDGL